MISGCVAGDCLYAVGGIDLKQTSIVQRLKIEGLKTNWEEKWQIVEPRSGRSITPRIMPIVSTMGSKDSKELIILGGLKSDKSLVFDH